jgi:hypothetical protein
LLPTSVLLDFNTSQLLIDTPTTIVTVPWSPRCTTPRPATSRPSQRKLNVIADGLADLMEQLAEERPDLEEDLEELRQAVGLEQHEGTGPPKR